MPRDPLSHIDERYYDLSAKFAPSTFYHVYTHLLNFSVVKPSFISHFDFCYTIRGRHARGNFPGLILV